MYCEKCGTQIDNKNAEYCYKCGSKLVQNDSHEPNVLTQQQPIYGCLSCRRKFTDNYPLGCPECGGELKAFSSENDWKRWKRINTHSVGNVGCPNCGSNNYTSVDYTWWGGAIWPKLFHHVKCLKCGTHFNSKTGDYNTKNIIITQVVGIAIVIILLAILLPIALRS